MKFNISIKLVKTGIFSSLLFIAMFGGDFSIMRIFNIQYTKTGLQYQYLVLSLVLSVFAFVASNKYYSRPLLGSKFHISMNASQQILLFSVFYLIFTIIFSVAISNPKDASTFYVKITIEILILIAIFLAKNIREVGTHILFYSIFFTMAAFFTMVFHIIMNSSLEIIMQPFSSPITCSRLHFLSIISAIFYTFHSPSKWKKFLLLCIVMVSTLMLLGTVRKAVYLNFFIVCLIFFVYAFLHGATFLNNSFIINKKIALHFSFVVAFVVLGCLVHLLLFGSCFADRVFARHTSSYDQNTLYQDTGVQKGQASSETSFDAPCVQRLYDYTTATMKRNDNRSCDLQSSVEATYGDTVIKSIILSYILEDTKWCNQSCPKSLTSIKESISDRYNKEIHDLTSKQQDFFRKTNQLIVHDYSQRLTLAKLGIKIFMNNFYSGIGYGNYLVFLPNSDYTALEPYHYPHNSIVEAATSSGFFGVLLFILFVGLSLLVAVCHAKSDYSRLCLTLVPLFYFLSSFFTGDYYDFRVFWYAALLVTCYDFRSPAISYRQAQLPTTRGGVAV